MIPVTGIVKVSMINTELKKVSTTRFSINNADVRKLAGKTSGRIAFSDFRGKSATRYPDKNWNGGWFVQARCGGNNNSGGSIDVGQWLFQGREDIVITHLRVDGSKYEKSCIFSGYSFDGAGVLHAIPNGGIKLGDGKSTVLTSPGSSDWNTVQFFGHINSQNLYTKHDIEYRNHAIWTVTPSGQL